MHVEHQEEDLVINKPIAPVIMLPSIKGIGEKSVASTKEARDLSGYLCTLLIYVLSTLRIYLPLFEKGVRAIKNKRESSEARNSEHDTYAVQ